MNLKELAALIPLVRPRPAATAAEQAEVRRRMLRDQLRADTAAAQVTAGNLAGLAREMRDRMERGETDDATLTADAALAHELRRALAVVESSL